MIIFFQYISDKITKESFLKFSLSHYSFLGLQLQRSTAGATRGGSVKLKHRIRNPVVTYTNSSKQTVLLVNSMRNGNPLPTDYEEDGRKNYSRNAQASKHVVKMLGKFSLKT